MFSKTKIKLVLRVALFNIFVSLFNIFLNLPSTHMLSQYRVACGKSHCVITRKKKWQIHLRITTKILLTLLILWKVLDMCQAFVKRKRENVFSWSSWHLQGNPTSKHYFLESKETNLTLEISSYQTKCHFKKFFNINKSIT